MKFKVTTSGCGYTKEQAEKLESFGFTFNCPQNVRNEYKPFIKNGDSNVEIEISTIEELVEFSEEWGEIIVTHGEIEIYDDYRE